MAYEVEFTQEFEDWWSSLDANEQESVAYSIKLLENQGVHLTRPYADTIKGSQYPNMRE